MVAGGTLEIRTLGGLGITCEGRAIGGFASRKVEALLVYLACTARPKSREFLAELLWEERTQSQGLSNLRVALSSLRKQLAAFLLIDRDTVGIEPSASVWLDAAELERQLAAVRGQRGPISAETVTALKHAAALYRGDFLEGIYLRNSTDFENWMVLERERIRAVYEQLVQRLLEALLASGSWYEAVEWGERWISLGQTPEPAFRALMHAYAGLGDVANVSTVYQRCVQALGADLGVEPSEQTRLVYATSLKGGPLPRPEVAPSVEAAATAAGPVRPPLPPPVQALLRQGIDGKGGVLDILSLAAVNARLDETEIGQPEADLLVRSALHHGQDPQPWLRASGSEAAAVRALESAWERYPKPGIRLRAVDALKELPGEEATAALERIARAEDTPEVRTEAALAAAARGRLRPVAEALASDLGTGREAAAMAGLVALADEFGLPAEAGPYPTLQMRVALAQRRWSAQRGAVLRRTLVVGLGAAVGWAIFGLLTPLFLNLASLEDYHASLKEVPSLSAWMLIASLMAFPVGGALGLVEGLTVGLADALWKGPVRPRRRLLFGGLAGLAHAFYLVLFTITGNYAPAAPSGVYVPVYALYGVLLGMLATCALPRLGEPAPLRWQIVRSTLVALAGAALTIPYVYLIYQDQAHLSLLSRLVNAFLLLFGMGMGCLTRSGRRR